MSDPHRAPLVTVIVPTHDHASTLDLAIESVLGQSLGDLDLVVVGDGISADTRDVLAAVTDRRVRVVEVPKTPSRAEESRHEILGSTTATYAAYLGDDDLMLPGHLAQMIALLDGADFVHPLPVVVAPDGELVVNPTDLSLRACREWHGDPRHNAVSLSGVVHRVDSYRQLPEGWTSTPPGRWSDHYMWQKWLTGGSRTFRTGTSLTVLKFDSARRRDQSPTQRRDEMLLWRNRSGEAAFNIWLEGEVLAATLRAASLERVRADGLADELARVHSALDVVAGELERTTAEFARVERQIESLRRTRTWRVHDLVSRWTRRSQ